MASARPVITSQRQVTFLACRTDAREHERATQRGVASRLAAMMGCRFDEVMRIATPGPVDLAVWKKVTDSLGSNEWLTVQSSASLIALALIALVLSVTAALL